jgi:hypothetical protein
MLVATALLVAAQLADRVEPILVAVAVVVQVDLLESVEAVVRV